MHIYRLTGRVHIWPCGGDLDDPADTHILAVNVAWPDPLTEEEVAERAMDDLLTENDYGSMAEWVWSIGPTVRRVSDAEIMHASGVPDLFCEEARV